MKMNSPQKTARVAAFVFLGIFFLGMSTELFIRPGMIVPGDAAATVRNIATSEALFILGVTRLLSYVPVNYLFGFVPLPAPLMLTMLVLVTETANKFFYAWVENQTA